MKNSTAKKIKQVPERYLVIGIDPHKKKHAAAVMTQDLMVRTKFKFNNSRSGFTEMLERARIEMAKTGCRGVIFAIEAASHYWRNLCYYLDKGGLPFKLINQFTLKRRREGKEINRRKNDFRDAEVAAQLLCSGEFTETKLLQGIYAELRAAYNAYSRLTQERSRNVNLIKGLLDGLFPEFIEVFKDPCGKTALSVLSVCPAPMEIAAISEERFIDSIREWHKGRLMKKKLLALYHVARSSIGIEAGSNSVRYELSSLSRKICFMDQELAYFEEALIKLTDKTEEAKYLLSITGLNYISVAGILAELGSFQNYHSAKQLIKMAGSNPTESESAGKRNEHTPMSKKGRPGLRHCIWNAVISLLRHNQEFRGWVKNLRERPVHRHPLKKKESIGAAANKLLRLVFALVKKQSFYHMVEPVSVLN